MSGDHDQPKRGGEPQLPKFRIPGYRIEGVLGSGATGIVYRARQISVDREVALKVLHPELVGAKGAEHRLQREARATARLSHPHIISSIDMGEVDGMWWYAMELVDGASLAERIRERPLSEREALRLFIPLVEALQHAFERGVVHRDVKPANILVERGGRALLVDLGLAFAAEDPMLTKSGATLGTPHYISPEQARDPSSADAQSDLWSLGATMYHAVCGRPPFSGDSVAEILSAVLYERVPDPREFAPALSSGFVLVLRKCLTRDRQRRYATPAELLSDLEKIRERRAPSVRRGSLEPLAHDKGRLLRIGGSAALVLAVAGILGWLALRETDPKLSAGGGPSGETGGETARAATGPVGALEQALAGPSTGLAPARERADVLLRLHTLSAADLARVEPLRAELERRIANESAVWRKEEEARIGGLLAARKFDDAATEARTALEDGLTRRIGAGALHEPLASELATWRDEQEQRVAAARAKALDLRVEALEQHFDQTIAPRVDALQQEGRFASARRLLLSEGVRAWIGDVEASRAGLSESELEQAERRLQTDRLAPRREALDLAWKETDANLASAVQEHVRTLGAGLESRTLVSAAERLRQAWRAELDQRLLTVDEMPLGMQQAGREALAKGESQLADLEQKLALEDAQQGLSELDLETAPLWRNRRYADVARTFQTALTDPWRAPVRATIELRLREARMLQELLTRAAQAVSARSGERTELRIQSIAVTGVIKTTNDPLKDGFELTLDRGRVYALALRPPENPDPTGIGPAVLSPEFVARFAGLPPEGTPGSTPEDRLRRALFLMREGDVDGAHAMITGGARPAGDPLVADLEARIAVEKEHREEAQRDRRGAALDQLNLVRRGRQTGENDAALVKRLEQLLKNFPDVLTEVEIRELHQLRDELAVRPQPEASLQDVFGPTSVEELPASRVRLRYEFGAARAGAFDPGGWIPSGAGWLSASYSHSDEDVLARSVPTLELKAPLNVQRDVVDVLMRFEQPSDAPPDLLLVTCAGFHVAFKSGPRGVAKCHVDTSDPLEVIRSVREGEGKEFAGWRAGSAFTVRLRVWRASGKVIVEVDGHTVHTFQPNRPSGNPLLLQIRSWEPMRLVSATIEATRHVAR